MTLAKQGANVDELLLSQMSESDLEGWIDNHTHGALKTLIINLYRLDKRRRTLSTRSAALEDDQPLVDILGEAVNAAHINGHDLPHTAIEKYQTALLPLLRALAAPKAVPQREVRRVYKKSANEYQEYLSARFNQGKGGNSGYRFRWQDKEWRYEHSDFDDQGDFDLLLGTAPDGGEEVRMRVIAECADRLENRTVPAHHVAAVKSDVEYLRALSLTRVGGAGGNFVTLREEVAAIADYPHKTDMVRQWAANALTIIDTISHSPLPAIVTPSELAEMQGTGMIVPVSVPREPKVPLAKFAVENIGVTGGMTERQKAAMETLVGMVADRDAMLAAAPQSSGGEKV